jgi:exonuclease SbcD
MKPQQIALLITDTHLADNNIPLVRSIWTQAIKVCRDRGLDHIYHLGDVCDSRDSQSQKVLWHLSMMLEEAHMNSIEVVVVPGNHDKTDYGSERSFLDVFSYHPGVTVVDKYHCEDWTICNDKLMDTTLNVHLVPFFSQDVYTISRKTPIDSKATNILLTHIGVDGAVMNSGIKLDSSLKGDDLFSEFTKVYVGHYHDQQDVGKKVRYIGAAYQHNYGEDNQKGFSILNSLGEIEFVKAEFPQYIKIVINLSKSTKSDLLKEVDKYKNLTDNVRFVFQGTREELAKVNKSEYSDVGIDVKLEEGELEVVDFSDKQVVCFDNASLKDEWKEFTNDMEEGIQEKGISYFDKHTS